jgi:hypothetical protein
MLKRLAALLSLSDLIAQETDNVSTIKVEAMYERPQQMTNKIVENIGPSFTNPYGYVKGPVARIRLTTVAEEVNGLYGKTLSPLLIDGYEFGENGDLGNHFHIPFLPV